MLASHEQELGYHHPPEDDSSGPASSPAGAAPLALPVGVVLSVQQLLPLDLRALEGVRGVASLVIVVGHILTFFVPRATQGNVEGVPSQPAFEDDASASLARWPAFALEYLSAVSLFFVLSGFTLVAVYERPAGPGEPPPLSTREQRRHFFRKRLARLAPLYYLGLLVGLVPFAVYSTPVSRAFSVPAALLGLQSLILVECNSWDGPLWTVGALAVCYLSFPALLCSMRRHNSAVLRIILAVTCVLSALLGILFLSSSGLNYSFVLHFFVGFRIPQFVAGMAAALLSQRRALRFPSLVAEVCSALLLFEAAMCALLVSVLAPRVAGFWWLMWCHYAEFLLLYLFVTWVSALATPGGGGPTRHLLASKPMQLLGQISYSLYCLHFPILVWCAWAVANKGVSGSAVPFKFPNIIVGGWFSMPVWSTLPLLLVCLLVATAAHRVLERPARAAIVKRSEYAALPG